MEREDGAQRADRTTGPDPEGEVMPEGVGILGFSLLLTPSDPLPAPTFVRIRQEAVRQLRG